MRTKEQQQNVRKGWGITGKLVFSIIGSVIIAVAILLAMVYVQMSNALLGKSEDLIESSMQQTIQETRAWMNKTLTALEIQRDTIEYEDMDIPEMQRSEEHTSELQSQR